MFDSVFGTLEDLLHWQFGQRIQPQFLDLLQLALIGISGVVLVVVIQAEQGENLVDGFYVTVSRRLPGLSLPSWCR